MESKIDFVIPWVDGNDKAWQQEKIQYAIKNNEDASVNRYRDWDNLQYWFRGVEKFASWVNKIHFITWGHIPEWLNTEHPKLHIVRHEDYIPKEFLPVFSANPIEINLHKIVGLEEQFVYFNDDLFLVNSTSPTDFFKGGKPNSMFAMCPYICQRDVFSKLIANDMGIINSNFDMRKMLAKNWKKWLSVKNGEGVLMTLLALPYPGFIGFLNTHLSNSYLKSTFDEVWKKEKELLMYTSQHRFRNPLDVNQHLMKYWQLVKGEFNPFNEKKFGKYYVIGRDDIKILEDIKKNKYKIICLNDVDENVDFEYEKKFLQQTFDIILPQKSSFER